MEAQINTLGKVRILQLNCQGAYRAMIDVGVFLCNVKCSFALLQEPYVSNGSVRGLPAAMRSFTNRSGSAAIVVNDVNMEALLVFESEHGLCVCVEGDFGRVYLCSVYCKFSEEIHPYIGFMDRVLELVGSNSLIFGIDANAISSAWFSKMRGHSSESRKIRRGVELAEWMSERDVYSINQPSELYTFHSTNGKSDIDVTLVNGAADSSFGFHWTILEGRGVSDHNKVIVEITPLSDTRGVLGELSERRWQLNNVNWTLYQEQIKARLESMPLSVFENLSIDVKLDRLNECVWDVNDLLFRRFRKENRKRISWWTSELNEARKLLRRFRKRFQRARACDGNFSELRAEFRRKTAEYKQLLYSAKEEEWRYFAEEHSDDPWGKVYRICRGRKEATIASITEGSVTHITWDSCAGALMRSFFPRSSTSIAPSERPSVAPELDIDEVEEAVFRLKSRKSPGLDGLTGEMVKAIWSAVPEYLFAIFSECVRENYFPLQWKCAKVIVLLKSNDKIRSNPRSYRGISLLPVLGKVLERVMVNRLMERIPEPCSLQFGFTPGRSVESAWLHVMERVKDSDSKYVLGIFVDFKGAFDYLEWEAVISKIREVGCEEVDLWKSYFSDRSARVVGRNRCRSMSVERGCPQGSIAGPFIWNLMMDSLLTVLASMDKTSCVAFADDLLILVNENSRDRAGRLGSIAMDRVIEWGMSVGVDVSMEKTATMLLKGKLSPGRNPIVRSTLGNLRYVKEITYLGIAMSERMNFGPHLVRVKKKLTAVVPTVRRMLTQDWGLSRKAARTIYDGLFVACATFGAPVWYETVKKDEGRKKILSCQRVMVLGMLPVCRTVSTEARQILAGVPPLDLELIRMGINYKLNRGLELSSTDWEECSEFRRLNLRDRKESLRNCVITRWQRRWEDSIRGRATFEFLPRVVDALKCCFQKLDLHMCFLLTGHGSLNAFLHQKTLAESPDCICGEREDWKHVLVGCPLYSADRDLQAMGISMLNNDWDFSRVLFSEQTRDAFRVYANNIFSKRRELMQ